jgi:hypothetical protein
MPQFITIKEAAILTGKAEITIRRLIKRLVSKNDPEIESKVKQEKTPSGYTYKVDKDWLIKELNMDYLLSKQEHGQSSSQTNQKDRQATNHEDSHQEKSGKVKEKPADQGGKQAKKETDDTMKIQHEVISILREQLKAKDKQLEEKHLENQELIRGQREAVITISKLTDKMLLTEGNQDAAPEVVDDAPGNAMEGVIQDEQEQAQPVKKKGLLRIFK